MNRIGPNADFGAPPTSAAWALVQRKFSPGRRRLYGVLLVLNAVCAAGIASLWITEPGPLPARLHAAFGTLVGVNLGWFAVLVRLWMRRRAFLVDDRVVLARTAVVACSVFLVMSVGVAVSRRESGAAAALGGVGATLAAVAALLLRRALDHRRALTALKAELEARS